jgi:hypothetical protein
MRSRLRAVFAVGAAMLLGLLLAANPAAAECDPDNAIFEDDFEFLDGSWGAPADSFNVEDGVLVLRSFWGQVNFQTQNEAANVCVDTTIVEAPQPDQSPIGLVWWWENWDNYYYMFYWADSSWVEVRRIVKGQPQNVVAVETLALKQGVGETNHIELQLRPKDATLFINGTQVTRFKGKPPKGGAPVGVYGVSPEDKPATWAFDNFVVSPVE